ncbi:nuclear inhibitor of protein phosphatase 1-like isoform X1 [Haliotis cracherodii]|uniref:nuclear inhibitor of protein phosphatase 1-like isoform X1 n=2 Tax=Haliotis cracherodii TaxID=6455 RepID=UPI0039E96184
MVVNIRVTRPRLSFTGGRTITMASDKLTNNFEVPTWAGKPQPGLHLDVTKDGKMIQKLMVDEKKCYFFGRNKQLCDFCIDHASCSRVHAALVWHKHLSRPFIMDLGSTHGTFIGQIRLEKRKPQQVPIDSEIHFGASTRIYIIRERPQGISNQPHEDKDGKRIEDHEGSLLGLPESETELDNLTEFNTAHNRRIASLVEVADVPNPLKRKHKSSHVVFNDEEEVINPEDIDPSVGRFRNLVQTTIIPTKRAKLDGSVQPSGSMTENITKRLQNFSYGTNLYGDLPAVGVNAAGSTLSSTYSIATKLGLPVPNLAPDIDHDTAAPQVTAAPVVGFTPEEPSKEPKKKKYAKEAWPGRKHTHNLLV